MEKIYEELAEHERLPTLSVVVEHSFHAHFNITNETKYVDEPLPHCPELYIEVMPWKSWCELQRQLAEFKEKKEEEQLKQRGVC